MTDINLSLYDFFLGFSGSPLILAFFAGLVISLFNTFGSLLVILLGRNISQKILDTGLGFASGLMLTASFTSLIIPALDYSGVLPVVIGILIGALFFDLADHIIPHKHFHRTEVKVKKKLSPVWLFIAAITIHNMPEGLSVGIAMGSNNLKDAIILMLAIGIQNIPEGFAVSLSALSQKLKSRKNSVVLGIKSGLVEIPLAILGAFLVSITSELLPFAMGFGAGAMLYVISDEIIPETHRAGHERYATFGVILGVVLMLMLDVSLG